MNRKVIAVKAIKTRGMKPNAQFFFMVASESKETSHISLVLFSFMNNINMGRKTNGIYFDAWRCVYFNVNHALFHNLKKSNVG